MDQEDQRDTAEEAANQEASDREQAAELAAEAVETCTDLACLGYGWRHLAPHHRDVRLSAPGSWAGMIKGEEATPPAKHDHPSELGLTVNGIPVKPCRCSTPDPLHWSIRDLTEALGRQPLEADRISITEPLPAGLELVKIFQPKKHRKICPGCKVTFDMFAEGQMSWGSDEKGLYMEHVPCGHRGRQGDGPDSPAGSYLPTVDAVVNGGGFELEDPDGCG